MCSTGALVLMQVVATFSPNDKKLKKDIEQLEKEIEIEEEKAKAKAKMTKPKSLPIRTTEPAGDGELLKPVKTTMLKPQQPQPTSKEYQATDENTVDTVVNTQVDRASSPSVRSDSVVELNNSMEVKAATIEVKKEIVVPRKPNTAFEFERVCNSLKGQPEVQREYVKSIEVEKYPVLFKELLSAGIMRCFIEALRRGFMPDDPQVPILTKSIFWMLFASFRSKHMVRFRSYVLKDQFFTFLLQQPCLRKSSGYSKGMHYSNFQETNSFLDHLLT